MQFNAERQRRLCWDVELDGLFSFLDGWLIFSIEVIGEHAVDVNDLTGRSGLEFAFEST